VSPFKGVVADMPTDGVAGRREVSSEEGGVQSASESLWLHKWLVREVMQNNTSTHRSPLDWLVAHLTAASPSLFLGAVIDDLWENVMACSAKSMSLSIYVRRIGVLEYAALRSVMVMYTLSMQFINIYLSLSFGLFWRIVDRRMNVLTRKRPKV